MSTFLQLIPHSSLPFQRAADHVHRQYVLTTIKTGVTSACPTSDSVCLETSISIDADKHRLLDASEVAQVLKMMVAKELSTSFGFSHVNNLLGTHNTLGSARQAVGEWLDVVLIAQRERWDGVGDVPCHRLLYQHLPLSVGVANIQRFDEQMVDALRWTSGSALGAGFADMAAGVWAHRQAPDAKRVA